MKSIRQVPGFCFLGMVVFVMVPGGFRSVPDTRRNMFFAQQKRSRDFTPGEITILHDLEYGETPLPLPFPEGQIMGRMWVCRSFWRVISKRADCRDAEGSAKVSR